MAGTRNTLLDFNAVSRSFCALCTTLKTFSRFSDCSVVYSEIQHQDLAGKHLFLTEDLRCKVGKKY